MNLFYTPDIITATYQLSEEESRHCKMVLRLREGDVVNLTNGIGTLFEARITYTKGKHVIVEVISRQDQYQQRNFKVHLAVAPTKNIDRFEWFLEKATEIGVDEITPLICEHSERRHLRNDRLEKIITAAVKQSIKAFHPVLNTALQYREFISNQHAGQLFIAHLAEKYPVHLSHVYKKGNDATILIGPEGDFSQSEITAAMKSGYTCISLGNSRLRTETAAVVACHTINLLNSL
jgi:16S rRNA (uracil1498-N3)-methyltransferase